MKARLVQIFFVLPLATCAAFAEDAVVPAPSAAPAATLERVVPPPQVPVASPKPAPIAFQIVHSRTTRVRVTEAPGMPGLPPVAGMVNVTVQKVADPGLPDPPSAPVPATASAKKPGPRGKTRGAELLFLSATVYDHAHTLLRMSPNGKPEDEILAWSNVDFNHFTGCSAYRFRYGDDSTGDCHLLMGIGNEDTYMMRDFLAKWGETYNKPQIPALPDLAASGPAFGIVKGGESGEAFARLVQFHDLYRREGVAMAEAHQALMQAHEERRAFLLAHPPKPKDIKIQIWKRARSVASSVQTNTEGGAR